LLASGIGIRFGLQSRCALTIRFFRGCLSRGPGLLSRLTIRIRLNTACGFVACFGFRFGTLLGLSFGPVSRGLLSCGGRLTLLFLVLGDLPADSDHARVLCTHRRFTRHGDYRLLTRLLYLVFFGLLQSRIGLLVAVRGVLIGARHLRDL
jgi:hypothetical protein